MLNLFKNKIKKTKLVRSFLTVILSVFLFLSCVNSADPDKSEFDTIVNNFIISIVGQAIFGNPSCGEGLIQIDSEALPTGTTIDIDFVEALFNNVNVCILGTSTSIDSNGQAFLEFITDYVMGENASGQFRLVLTGNTPDGQEFNQFTDITVQGIAILPPTEDGSTTFTVEIPDMGLPEVLLLLWDTLGIKEGTAITFDFDAALGTVSPAAGTIGADGTISVTYTPNAVQGIQTITATITLTTPPDILALCPIVAPSKTITATINVIQTGGMAMGLTETNCMDGLDDDGDALIDCADPDCLVGPTPPCEAPEVTCDDMIDNDGDGATDCADADCAGVGTCEMPEVTCDDALDNDADGDVDCDDADCATLMCAPGMTCTGIGMCS
ncbi:MAG: hypothetical protein ACR2NW_00920 [Thermodesulfobacteriota bacterium]